MDQEVVALDATNGGVRQARRVVSRLHPYRFYGLVNDGISLLALDKSQEKNYGIQGFNLEEMVEPILLI